MRISLLILCAFATRVVTSPVEARQTDDFDDPCVKLCKAAVVTGSLFGGINACTIASNYVSCLENCAKHSSNVSAEQLAEAETGQRLCSKQLLV
ncbi:hypothetical protein F5887DRAFT_932884 [Amanita rubescens]|nr:hypothetical protein F5887DRAFT_932884 [Amanita rubescens]